MQPVNEIPKKPEDFSVDLSYAVADAQALAREQVQAAGQRYLDRIREHLESVWRESLEQTYQERFGEIEARLRPRLESVVRERTEALLEERLETVRAGSRRETLKNLNNLARRMRAAESRDEIRHALLEAAGETGSRAVILYPSDVDLNAAPAVASALESKDTVVAAATAGQLSEAVLDRLSDGETSGRVYLIPLVVSNQAVGVLAAAAQDHNDVDITALELLATIAAPHLPDPPVPAPVPAPVMVQPPPPRPGWSDLSRSEQEVHLRAQRYARNTVAQWLLNDIRRVYDGRANRNLYGAFRDDIDAARNEFHHQFFEHCPSMVDYLHLELVRSLARDDADVLGPDYPGPVQP